MARWQRWILCHRIRSVAWVCVELSTLPRGVVFEQSIRIDDDVAEGLLRIVESPHNPNARNYPLRTTTTSYSDLGYISGWNLTIDGGSIPA